MLFLLIFSITLDPLVQTLQKFIGVICKLIRLRLAKKSAEIQLKPHLIKH
jgi:hypothetical protein